MPSSTILKTHKHPCTVIKQQTVNILVVDTDQQTIAYINDNLSSDYSLLHSDNTEDAQLILEKNEVAIMMCSEYLPGENGLLFMARMNRKADHTQPILMSEGISEDLLAFAINEIGVLKYLKKPLSKQALFDAISGAREHYLTAVCNDMLQTNYNAMVKESQSLPYMARRIKVATPIILNNICTSATAASGTIILMFLLIIFLSITATVGLYMFKSILGINLFTDSHLTDLFR